MRIDGRADNQIREIKILRNINRYAEGSVLFSLGNTKVICTASIKEDVPPHLKGQNTGWLTAEYNLLPRATQIRNDRERFKIKGRTMEIQRLIGRCLRAAVDLGKLGERTIIIDCDVIEADGGTRTASINAGMIALFDALKKLEQQKIISGFPLKNFIGAISAGILNNKILIDLIYEEDNQANADFNIVLNDKGKIIEIQGSCEKQEFSKKQLDLILSLSKKRIIEIINQEKKLLKWK